MKINDGDKPYVFEPNRGDVVEYHDDKYILNPHFNMHTHDGTHDILDNIAQQFIRTNGMAGFFLPKEFGDVDRIFGEELEVSFNKAWQFAFYLESYTGFGGLGASYTYSGFSANDEMKIMINPSLFQNQCDGRMPEIGDWVYLKNDNSVFSVRYVDPYNKFYQFGKNSQYFLILSKVDYNQQDVNPIVQNDMDFNLFDYTEDDMTPLKNLNGRLDTDVNELITNDYVKDEAEKIIIDDRPVTGSGVKPSQEDKNSMEITDISDINKLLGGRSLR